MCKYVRILAETFADYDHYISAAENFPKMPLETIKDVLNGNWLADGLYSNMGYLNKWILALNFLGPPANYVDHKNYCSLSRSIAEVSRERKFGKEVHPLKPKSAESFIRGYHATLMEFSTLLENLIVNSLH